MNDKQTIPVFNVEKLPCEIQCVNRTKGTIEKYILRASRNKTGMHLNKPEQLNTNIQQH